MELLYQMIIQNYNAEETQLSYWGIGSWLPLELLICNNLLTRMGWNRLFFNEAVYVTDLDYAKETAKKQGIKKVDLRDEKQREKFA